MTTEEDVEVRYYGADKSFTLWSRQDPTRQRTFAARDAKRQPNAVYVVVRWLAEHHAERVLASFLDESIAEGLRKACVKYVDSRGIRSWQDVEADVLRVLEEVVAVQAAASSARASQARHAWSQPRILQRGASPLEEEDAM